MFYHYLVGNEPDAATKYLPEPELIRALVPNPGGYGTGMGDWGRLASSETADVYPETRETSKDEDKEPDSAWNTRMGSI